MLGGAVWSALVGWLLVDDADAARPRVNPPEPERRRVGAQRPTSAPGLTEPVADRAHRLDQVRVLLAELGPEPPHVDVDRARAAVVLVAPHPREQLLAGEHLARVRREELQQLVLHVREVERPVAERGLVGLEVEHEVAVLDDLGPRAPTGAPEQVAQPRLELLRVERREAEVVEEVLAQLELGELRAADEQQRPARAARRACAARGRCRTRPPGPRRRRRPRRPSRRAARAAPRSPRSRPPSTGSRRGRASAPAAAAAGPGRRGGARAPGASRHRR